MAEAKAEKAKTESLTLRRGRIYRGTMYGPGTVDVPAHVAKAFERHDKAAGVSAKTSRKSARRSRS